MEQENTLIIINKLVDSKVSIEELRQLAQLLETPDFKETYQLIENIGIAINPIGRIELRNEFKLASKEYHKEIKVIKLQNFKNWALPAIAACFFVVVGISTLTNIQNHSDKNIYESHSGVASYKTELNSEIK